jgi:acyl-coenzyme A thioesterase 13
VPTPTHAHGPFQELVGYETFVDAGLPHLRLPVRRELLNPHGVLHGGVSLTLLDAIGGRVLVDRPIPGTGQRILSSVTVTLTTDFLLGVRDGVLYATGSPDHIGKTVAHVSVQLRHNALDGPLVSRGLGTYRVYTRSLVSPI